ncbi:MAG: hypothetical protein J6I73_04865 [Treponema sp.]|nr:hypothetical protein [Treponema sp.]
MVLSNEPNIPIEEFVDDKTIKALSTFIASNKKSDFNKMTDIIANAFGFSGKSFSQENSNSDKKCINSFANNLALLIQKTWVEKTDVALKEQVLYQLEQLCSGEVNSWKAMYVPFLDTLYDAVYLMFGQQVKADEFKEYALRIDPEFGIFWWYVSNLPHDADWDEAKCRDAVLLGMYFLANY